jgi:hypothetical protein
VAHSGAWRVREVYVERLGRVLPLLLPMRFLDLRSASSWMRRHDDDAMVIFKFSVAGLWCVLGTCGLSWKVEGRDT